MIHSADSRRDRRALRPPHSPQRSGSRSASAASSSADVPAETPSRTARCVDVSNAPLPTASPEATLASVTATPFARFVTTKAYPGARGGSQLPDKYVYTHACMSR